MNRTVELPRVAFPAAAFVAVLAVGGLAWAQDHSETWPYDGPAAQVLGEPDDVELPEPGSFAPGVRLVYFQGTGSPTDTAPFVTLEIVHLDLLHLDPEHCAMRTTTYGVDMATGLVSLREAGGFVAGLGTCGAFWIPTERLLETAQEYDGREEVVLGTYELGGQTFDVVRIGSATGSGDHQTYQASTGILVASSYTSATPAVQTIGPDLALQDVTSITRITHTHLLGMRQIGWYTGEPLPDDVRAANRLFYTCTVRTTTPGAADVEIECEEEALIGERTQSWALARVLHYDLVGIRGRSLPREASTVITAGGPGGLYASPTVLAGLVDEQIIDFDPYTGTRTFVSHVDYDFVTVTEQGEFHRRDMAYDLGSGWLIASTVGLRDGERTATVRALLESVE